MGLTIRHVGIKFSNSNRTYVYRVPSYWKYSPEIGDVVVIPGNVMFNNPRRAKVVEVHGMYGKPEYKERKNISYVELHDYLPKEERDGR